MGKRVQVLDYSNYNYNGEVKVKYEGEIIQFMTHLDGVNTFIHSHEMALIQLDDGYFVTAPIENIRFKK